MVAGARNQRYLQLWSGLREVDRATQRYAGADDVNRARTCAAIASVPPSVVKRARADRTHGRTGLTTAEREELARLRRENRELRTERDGRTKAATFFAKHQA